MSMHANLLIVDKDPLQHQLVDLVFKQSRQEVKYQFNYKSFLFASDALSYILNNNDIDTLPDLILLDLNTPFSVWGFLDFFETIVPRLEKHIDIIILASSVASADKALNYKCVKGFLPKPFTETLLKNILNSSLFVSMNFK